MMRRSVTVIALFLVASLTAYGQSTQSRSNAVNPTGSDAKVAEEIAKAASCLASIAGGPQGKLGTIYKGVSALEDGVATQRAIVGAAEEDPETGLQTLRLEDEEGNPIATDDVRYMRVGGCTVLGFVASGDPTGLLREFISYERKLLDEFEKALRFYLDDPVPIRSTRFSGCGTHNGETNVCTQLTAEVFEDGAGGQFTDAWFRLGNASTTPGTLRTDTVIPGAVRAEVELRFGGRTLYFADVNYKSLRGGGYISLKRLDAVNYEEVKEVIRKGAMDVNIFLKDVSLGDVFTGPGGWIGSTTYSGVIDMKPVSGGAGTPIRPSAPDLRATSNPESVTLTVSGGDYEKVRLYRSTKSDFEVTDSMLLTTLEGTTAYADRSLEAGRQYYYRAVGVTEAGPSVNPSPVASGMLDVDYRLENLPSSPVDNITPDDRITVSGLFESIDGTPVPGAQVSVAIPDIEWSFPIVETGRDGSFSVDIKAPVIPGAYTVVVAAQGDGAARTRSILLDVQSDPKSRHDLAITGGQVSERKTAPGNNLTVAVDVANSGEAVKDEATLTAQLVAPSGTIVSAVQDAITQSLQPGQSTRQNLPVIVPTSTDEGAYEVRVEVSRDGGERKLNNNIFSRDIFVQSPLDAPPTYRTAQSDLQGIGATRSVAGVTVEIASATPTSVQFEVDGNLTGELAPNDQSVVYWMSEEDDKLLILDAYSWGDTSATVQAGAPTDDARAIPPRLIGKPGFVATSEVQVPQSSNIDVGTMEYAFGPDLTTLITWDDAEDDESFGNWTAGLNHRLSQPIELEDYQATLRWQSLEGEVFYQRALVRPVPLHDVTIRDITASNTLQSGDVALPDFFPGAPINVEGIVANEGDYSERVQVEIALTAEGSDEIIYVDQSTAIPLSGRSTPNASDGEEQPFTFRIPTLGLAANTYELTVRVSQSNDSDPENNIIRQTIDVTRPPRLEVTVAEGGGPYNVGDRIPISASVARQEVLFPDANVRAVVTRPTGKEDGVELSYDSESGVYRGDFIANYGGNYHVQARAERRPYRPGTGGGLRQTSVQVSPILRNSRVGVTEVRTLSVRASNVGGLYGASVDLTYNPSVLEYIRGDVSTRVRGKADVPVTFLENEREDRVITGFSRLEPDAGGIDAAEGLILLRAAFGGREEGASEISFDNVRLVDSTGTAMAVQTVSTPPVFRVDEGPVRIEVAGRDTLKADAESDTLDVFLSGADRVKTVETMVSFPRDLINVSTVLEGPGLKADGTRTLFTSRIDDDAGTVQFAVTRAGETGIPVPSERIASIVYRPISSGEAAVKMTGSTVLSSFEDLALAHDARGNSVYVQGGDGSGAEPTPRVRVAPSDVLVDQEETFEVAFTAEDVQSVYAVNARLVFPQNAVEFLEARKGRALTSGGGGETAIVSQIGRAHV